MKRLSLPAAFGVVLALLFAGLGGAPAFAGSNPVPIYLKADPCPGASLCGNFLTGQFKGSGKRTSQFAALPNLTVSRASFAYGENADGSLKGFQAGQARLTSKGLGVFEATTNLFTWSEDFTNAAWTKVNATITANSTAAPNGTVTASTVTNNAGSANYARFRQGIVTTIGTTYTATAYVKQGSTRYALLTWTDPGNFDAFVDLQSCAMSNVVAGVTMTCEQKANGWERVSLTRTAATTAMTFNVAPATASGGSNSAPGDTLLAWGVDVRVGAYAVPYCPTTSSTATCAADQVSFANSAPAQGSGYTLFAGFNPLNLSTGAGRYVLALGTSRGSLFATSGAQVANGIEDVAQLSTSPNPGVPLLVASAFAPSSQVFSANGLPAVTTTNATADGSATGVFLGQKYNGSTYANGYITRFAIYPRALSGTELAALTSGTDTSSLSLNFASGLYKNTAGYVRTNLAAYSDTLSTLGSTGAGWTLGALTGAPSATTVGGVPLFKMVPNTTTVRYSHYQGPFTHAAGTYTLSAVAAPGCGYNWLGLSFGSGSNVDGAYFNLATGAVGTVVGGTTAGMKARGDGTYLVWITRTLLANGAYAQLEPHSADNQGVWTADGVSGVCANSVDLEAAGGYPPSHIVTLAGSATGAGSVVTYQSTNPADVGNLTFTSGGGYAPDCNGNLVSFAANVPRITCAGVLIEEARTNLWFPSRAFSIWPGQSAVTTTDNVAVAPDGTTTASLVVPTTASAIHRINITAGVTNGTAYTAAVYAKSAGYRYLYLNGAVTPGVGQSTIDLLTCTIAATANGTPVAASLVNGWCRIAVTATAAGTANNTFLQINNAATANDNTFAGDGVSGVYLWQGDLQAGSFATSPILTTSATVTRPADVMSYGGLSLAQPFSLAGAATSATQAVIARIASLSDGTNNLDIDANGGTTGYVTGNTLTGGGGSVGGSASPVVVAASISSGAVHGSGNGQAATTLGGTQTLSTVTTLRVGDLYTGGRPINGYVSQVRIYPYAANDNELTYRSARNW